MPRSRLLWTFAVTAVAAFMVSLDNLVVTMALPAIRTHLHTSLSGLEWTVNAYTLSFAVLILTGAALGDRFGRRRVLVGGLAVFTVASAVAALAPDVATLLVARAVQGAGAAAVLPLTFTVLSAAVPAERRGAALGVLGGVAGLAVAVGPLIGGAVVQGASWQWIFWINVPIGLICLPLAATRLTESRARAELDLPGLALAGAGLFGVVLGLVRSSADGWTSPMVLSSLLSGVAVLAAFLAWETRTASPMLPLRLFRNRAFSASNGASLLFSFGMFGSIFLLAQFLQTAQRYSPLGAGLRTLPWTAMPLLVAPIAGPLSDRIGSRPLMATGLALQGAGLAWLASLTSPTVAYAALVTPFVVCGLGMSLFFIPVANAVMGAVPENDQGVASGANNAIRELGGVLGIAVLATVFAAHGGYASPATFTAGVRAATFVGAAIVAVGALTALAIPRRRRTGGPDWRAIERRAVAGHRADLSAAAGRLAAQAPQPDTIDIAHGNVSAVRIVVGSATATLAGVTPAAARRLGELAEPRLVGSGRYGRWWWLSFADPTAAAPVTVAGTHLAVTDTTGGVRPPRRGLRPAGAR